MTANKVDFYIQHFKKFESNKSSEVLKFQLFDIESSLFVQLLSLKKFPALNLLSFEIEFANEAWLKYVADAQVLIKLRGSSIEVLSLSPLWGEKPRNHQRSVW